MLTVYCIFILKANLVIVKTVELHIYIYIYIYIYQESILNGNNVFFILSSVFSVKERLQTLLNLDRDFTEEDYEKVINAVIF